MWFLEEILSLIESLPIWALRVYLFVWIVFLFLFCAVTVDSAVMYLLMELCTFLVLGYMWKRASSKEVGPAGGYLLTYTLVLGVLFWLDFMLSVVMVGNYCWALLVYLSVLTFFSKLPIYGLHYWLPKAHVECYVVRSVVLARLLLKLGVPAVRSGVEVVSLRLLATVLALYAGLNTGDFKVWVAFSSITHMTLCFSRFYRYSPELLSIYLVFHTLLSAMMFYWYNRSYSSTRQRNLSMFRGYGGHVFLSWFWLGVPVAVVFLMELGLIGYAVSNMRVVMSSLFFAVLLRFGFMAVLIHMRGGFKSNVKSSRSSLSSSRRVYYFMLILLWFLVL